MLQAMNTGHDGSLTTIHANTPRDAMSRLKTMVLMAGIDLPSRAIREQAVSAIDIIVQIKRYEDGVRRVQSISELVGMEGDTPQLQEIFRFVSKGKVNRKITGDFIATGVVPHIVERLRENDVDVPMHLFHTSTAASTRNDQERPAEDRERSW
jgi:pilus assembly protein CpaF